MSSQAFTASGSDTFVVPTNVTSITVKVWAAGAGGGAGGTSGVGGAGGGGGYVGGKIEVTPLETLTIHVGGLGGAGAYGGTASGGGGGGAGKSSIFRDSTPLFIAGGGAGGGGGDNSSATAGGAGGAGGGSTGGTGGSSGNADGGSGGTQSDGGAGGTGGVNPGIDGKSPSESPNGGGGAGGSGSGSGGGGTGGTTNGGAGGAGDSGEAGYAGGGGGGAGYSGGGGGSASVAGEDAAGGGGGGSNYIIGTATDTTNSQASGQTPPNTGDPDYAGSVGVGGNGGSTSSAGSAGNNGRIVIIYTGGEITDWGITTVGAFTGTHTDIKAMGGTSPNINDMTVFRLWYYSEGSGTLTIALYTGGALTNAQGAVRRTEAHNISVSAGWNAVDVPDYSWLPHTITWIAWAKSSGANTRASNSSADAGDFQSARGRYTVSSPADYDETTALPSTMGAGVFDVSYWHSVYAEYSYPAPIFSGGIQFVTASSQYLESISSFTPLATVTVCFWLYLDSIPDWSVIIGCHDRWEIAIDPTGYIVSDIYQASSGNFRSKEILTTGIWYHIACTRNTSNNGSIYINGYLDNTSSILSLTPSAGNLRIGRKAGAASEYLNGSVEDMRIYNRILSQDEIETIYYTKGTDGIVQNLNHRWIFNEGSESSVASGSGVIKDRTVNGLHMTPNNSPTFGGTRLKFKRFG